MTTAIPTSIPEKKPLVAMQTKGRKVIYSHLNPVNASNVEDMATQAGLDFDVCKEPLYMLPLPEAVVWWLLSPHNWCLIT